MTRTERFVRHCCLLVVTVGSGMLQPVTAWAQSERPAEILVTARRQAERQVDVPLAVDVVAANAIGAGQIDSMRSLAARIPGLSYEGGWGGFFSTPALRGQNQPNVRSIDGVGIFVDGVYQADRDAIDGEPLDLERVEVVQGPQNALFGHSSFSGLIHFVAAQPTERLFVRASVDLGTNAYRGLSAALSGPLNHLVKARLAASWRSMDGTETNAAQPGQHLGDAERFALAASLSTRDDSGPVTVRLAARYGESRSGYAPSFMLDYRSYNCGAQDPRSGYWSYYCGKPAIPAQTSISPQIPDSYTRSGQVALYLSVMLGSAELRSQSSFYQARTVGYRDFDGSAEGETYGVCILGATCAGPGIAPGRVVRQQQVEMVLRRAVAGREFAQELRLIGDTKARLAWQLGGTAIETRVRTTSAWGAARGGLASGERLTSLVLSDPLRVGPTAAINAAIVDDPNSRQIVQSDVTDLRRTLALFATGEYRLSELLRLRGELRVTWERLVIDSQAANFTPSFGKALGPRNFSDVTPRLTIDWRPAAGLLLYASLAKGSRSGGINTIPDLLPAEQTYGPETNWTRELGLRYFGNGILRAFELSAYDIDWSNAQILGLSETPGITANIIRNTTGIRTRGLAVSAELAPVPWLTLDLAYSYADPRFKAGSEDPGAGVFCGLSGGNAVSNLCKIRPSTISPGQLVPDISGLRPSRAVQTSWNIGVSLWPLPRALPGLRLHADLSHEGDVFDNNVHGLRWGARTPLGARASLDLGHWAIDLWGTNLTDLRYVNFSAPRAPNFYTGIPRPTDLIVGEGRRIGLTLRFTD